MRIDVGLLIDYPKGTGDIVEFISNEGNPNPEWQNLEVEVTSFSKAFMGNMSELMKAASGEIELPDNSVEDCIYTMACVEAAYVSSLSGATKLPK